VLLGGDTDVLPARFGFTRFYGGTEIATDLYYQCLDGNWNADGDHNYGEGFFADYDPGDDADLMPDVYVGRAPTVTLAQAQLFVDKTLMYEKTPVTDYMKDFLLFAEVLFPQDWQPGQETITDGASLAELVVPYIQENPHVRAVRLYENYTDPAVAAGRPARVAPGGARFAAARLQRGGPHRARLPQRDARRGRVLENSDAFGLTNGNRLINLYAINCTSNAIDFPSIGEAFLLCPTGGAVTNIGSTNFDFPSAGQVYEDEYFRLMFEDSVTAVGEAHARSKIPFLGYSTYDGVNRWTQFTLLMLGDPELHVFTNTPRTLAVSHATTMSASDTVFTVHVQIGATPLYGARVTTYKAGMDYRVGTTDGAGNVTLGFRPDSVGSFKVTVTAFDCVPYQASVTLTAATPPVMSALNPVIDDDSSGGTSGNSNGIIEAGETVDVKIPVKNNGGSSAPSLTATLSTSDPKVSITNANCTYGTLAAGATSTPATGFRFHLDASAADQREVAFVLMLHDSNNRSYRSNLQFVMRAPELRHLSHSLVDQGGNSDGRPDAGELIVYYVKLRNCGTGSARGVTGKMRNFDGLATVYDSTARGARSRPARRCRATRSCSASTIRRLSSRSRSRIRMASASRRMVGLTYPAAPANLAGWGARPRSSCSGIAARRATCWVTTATAPPLRTAPTRRSTRFPPTASRPTPMPVSRRSRSTTTRSRPWIRRATSRRSRC
jgi:hypothetical protein